MSQGANLFEILSTNSACAAFVGSGPDAQIYNKVIPQGREAPAYVFSLLVGRPENVIDDAAVADYELFQFDSWALDADTAIAMREAARAALEDLEVTIPRQIGVRIVAFYPDDFEKETRRFKQSIGVAIWSQR